LPRIICVLIALAIPVLVAADADDVRKELKALEGKWKTVAVEAMGMSFPKEVVPDFSFVVAAGGKSTGRTPQGEFSFTMIIDPGKNPRTIENRHETGPEKGKKQFGIYKLEGDKFTVCMARAGGAETDRPKDFATKDTNSVLFVFERVKEDKKP
jgi:uncharacterized protein (TIGR03067 family)